MDSLRKELLFALDPLPFRGMERSHVYIGCETGILKGYATHFLSVNFLMCLLCGLFSGVRLPGGTFTNISTDPSSLVNKDRAVDVVFYDKSDSSNTKSERVRFVCGIPL